MKETTKEEVLEHMEKADKDFLKEKEQLDFEKRALRLMESGLEKLPLERDFYLRAKDRYERRLAEHEKISKLLTFMKYVVNKA